MKDAFLGLFFFVFIYLVAVPHGMWDPGSPAPGWTHVPGNQRTDS